MLELKRKIMITKVRKRLLIGLSFIICHLSFSVALTSCADYNVTDDFTAEPDPSYVEPYLDLDPVKSYIDREKYPNLKLGATMKVSEFNKQELAHAACVTNCDDVSFGTTLMAGSIINGKGVMNFLDMSDLLSHVEEIDYEVYGSPIVANANQPDEWLALLTAPIEVTVEYIEVKAVDYATIDEFTGTVEKGKAEIVKYDGANALKIGTACNVRIIEGFEVDPAAKYTTTFWAKTDKDASYTVTFSGNKVNGSGADGKFTLKAGKLTKVVIESQSAPDETEGYLRIENTRSAPIYISKVEVGCYPDNHRPQTEKEAIDEKTVMDNGMYDLKHSTEKIYWQDILGSDNYAPAVSKEASEAYVKYSGDPAQLKFFISETGLENEKKFESLMYWINIWDAKGAKIDGINAKLNLVYSEDAATLEENNDILDNLLMNLALSGKLVRVSNFDIKYQDATGANVAAKDITAEQRQKLADYNAYVISSYMTIIPKDKQAGICKGNLADTSDPVGLWAVDTKSKDWVRTATYKAFCDGLTAK